MAVDDGALAKMLDEPAAKRLQDVRGWKKLSSTYLERMDKSHPKTFIYPDGNCHTSYRHCALDTSRLCVSGDTLLETSLGCFRISDLDLTFRDKTYLIRTHENRQKKITAKWFKGYEEMFRIEFDTGAYIECTAGHRIFTQTGWKQAASLRIGSTVVADTCFSAGCGFRANEDISRTLPILYGSSRMVFCRIFSIAEFSEPASFRSFGSAAEGYLENSFLVAALVRPRYEVCDFHELFDSKNDKYEKLEVQASVCQGGNSTSQNIQGWCVAEKSFHTFGCGFRYGRTGVSRVPGENFSWKVFEGCGKRGSGLLACFFPVIRSCGEAEGSYSRKRKPSAPSRSSYLLVQKPWGNPNCERIVEKEGRLPSAVEIRKELDGGFYVSEDPNGFRGGWKAPHKSSSQSFRSKKEYFLEKSGLSSISGFRYRCLDKDAGGCRESIARVVSIRSVGVKGVWDITVEGDHSYVSQGIYHHNSASEPSLLNQPSRENAFVKEQFKALLGHICLFSDYGAQEARGVAIMSKDPNLVQFMKEGRDFHKVWALKILEKHDRYFKILTKGVKDEAKAIKMFRGEVKAKFVFAGFYGATVQSRANKLMLPLDIAKEIDNEFWEEFSGVKRWQERVIKTYRKVGYVESLLGYRRHGPMGEPQVINAGVQASGADMTMAAWAKVGKYAYENDMPWLYLPIAVHDDLTGLNIPIERKWEAVEIIAGIMTDFSEYEWSSIVPMVVEISEGPHWGHKIPIGDFTSGKSIKAQVRALREKLVV